MTLWWFQSLKSARWSGKLAEKSEQRQLVKWQHGRMIGSASVWLSNVVSLDARLLLLTKPTPARPAVVAETSNTILVERKCTSVEPVEQWWIVMWMERRTSSSATMKRWGYSWSPALGPTPCWEATLSCTENLQLSCDNSKIFCQVLKFLRTLKFGVGGEWKAAVLFQLMGPALSNVSLTVIKLRYQSKTSPLFGIYRQCSYKALHGLTQ